MPRLFYFGLIASVCLLSSCEDEPITPATCSLTGVIKDYGGLDGCGYIIETSEGGKFDPMWIWGWCGTQPLPEGATQDPLYNFIMEDGMVVSFSYELYDGATICMTGTPVVLTCIEEITSVF